MTHPVDRALRLWFEPLPADEDALNAFRMVYTDPLFVNGVPAPLHELVTRARMLQQAFQGLEYEILERIDSSDRSAFGFRLSGRHVGPLATPLGEVAPVGRVLSLIGMDIFEITNDRVRAVRAIADYLGLLMQAGVAALVQRESDRDLALPTER
jgi:hypothetical protein